VKKGIGAVSVGVNDRTAPPAVPSVFVWKYANESVLATWHPGLVIVHVFQHAAVYLCYLYSVLEFDEFYSGSQACELY